MLSLSPYFRNATIASVIETKEVFVFDLNGLLIDDEPIQLEATNRAIEGKSTSVISREDWVTCCVGHKPKEYLPKFVNGNIEEIVKKKDQIYAELISLQVRNIIRPGVEEFLNYFRGHIPFALATSTTQSGVSVILGAKGLNILSYFSFIVCGDEVLKAKPHPEIYFKVKEHFGNNLSYVVFEDSQPGIESAVAAGMQCVAIPNEFTRRQNLQSASLVLSNLSRDAFFC